MSPGRAGAPVSAAGRGADYLGLADYYTPPDLPPPVLDRWADLLEAGEPELGVEPQDPADLKYLEGHVGGAAWLRGLYSRRFTVDGSNLEAMDLDPEAEGLLLPGGHDSQAARRGRDLVQTGFMITDPFERPDAVVGNPPYGVPKPCPECSPNPWTAGRGCKACKGKGVTKTVVPLAAAHTRRGLELGRHVLFLLRLGFLGSRSRADLWPSLRHVFVLTPRVQFSQVCPRCQGTGIARLDLGKCSRCKGSGKARGRSGSDSSEYATFWFDREWRGRAKWGGSHVTWREA